DVEWHIGRWRRAVWRARWFCARAAFGRRRTVGPSLGRRLRARRTLTRRRPTCGSLVRVTHATLPRRVLGVARLACHPARLTPRGRRRGRGLDAIEPPEAPDDVGARTPPVIE